MLLINKLPKMSIGFLCPDQQGGMWVGTNEGLLRLMPQTIHVFSKAEGLPEDNVYPVYEDRAGHIWAGIWENSLVRSDGASFKDFSENRTYFLPYVIV